MQDPHDLWAGPDNQASLVTYGPVQVSACERGSKNLFSFFVKKN